MAMVLAIAAGAGAAIAYGLSYLHPVVSTSAASVSQILGVPILGAVSVAFPARHKKLFKTETLRISIAAACLLVAFGAAIFLSQRGYRLTVPAIRHLVGS